MKMTKGISADETAFHRSEAAIELINSVTKPRLMFRLGHAVGDIDGSRQAELVWPGDGHNTGLGPVTIRLRAGEPYETIHAEERLIWVLPRSSTQQRSALRERGVSYVDLARGTVHLLLPGVIVDRDNVRWPGHPAASAVITKLIDPFTDSVSRVVRVLLTSAFTETESRSWGVRELAVACGVNRTSTSEVVRYLARANALVIQKRGRASDVRLLDPTRLIDLWSRRYEYSDNSQLTVHAPIGNTARFLKRLPEYFADMRWALTLQAAASMLAPHASWEKIHLYVDVPDDHALLKVAAVHGWQPGNDGNLVLMRPHYASSVWYGMRTIDSLPHVGLPQLLVDLWRYPVRGREQALHLIEVQRERMAREHRGTGVDQTAR